jgi:hypothetical protein
VQIIRNGAVLHEIEGSGELDLLTGFRDEEALSAVLQERRIGPSPTAYYYLRVVQEDAHIGWSSPVFLIAGD